MSSPQLFQASSPYSAAHGLSQKSRYTYRNLAQLAQSVTNCPLRVIAHVDLDAFYAQCEMVRLNVPETQPLAVQQWQGLIAINYPARKFGLNRHITITEAKKLCPNLIMQHVPTWKEGQEKWDYHDESYKNSATHKVSLDPYRLESRRILTCIKENLPADLQRVEKASVDEVFLDLSAQVHSVLLKRYPEITGPAPYDDPMEFLPLPHTSAIDWKADALVDLGEGGTEEDNPDWDDISTLIGSEIVREIRAAILRKLKYTCSAGIAQNKMLAKLGSAHKKPNQQTVIRNRAVENFLMDFKFTQIRGLGGKLGEQISSAFNTDTVKDLLLVSQEQLKLKLGDETGIWVYQIIRGIDTSEVNSRTLIKSMLSAKSFQPSITTLEQATRWLRIFTADIYSRLIEEGILENKRRPKTMNLHHRHGTQNKTRSCTIPLGKRIDELGLFETAKNLFDLILHDGHVWPCTNLSLSVGGFEDGISGNMNIGAFLIKGEDAKLMRIRDSQLDHERSGKRRRLESPTTIKNFFSRQDIARVDDNVKNSECKSLFLSSSLHSQSRQTTPNLSDSINRLSPQRKEFFCQRCNEYFQSFDTLQSHKDWHLARDFQDIEDAKIRPVKPLTSTLSTKNSVNTKVKSNTSGNLGKGQSRIKFG